jgi:MFS family permease
MDKDRQIRFLYPPLIFLSSITLGVWLDYPNELSGKISDLFSNQNTTSIVVALLGVGSLILVLGYLIGTITILLLRLLFAKNEFNYEFKLSDQTYKKIGKLILKNQNDHVEKKERMYAAVVFDHSYISKNTHRWIVRRWNAFLIASFSVVGLICSVLFGWLVLEISPTWGWLLTVIVFITCFILQGSLSWIETMRMVAFLTKVKKNDEDRNSHSADDDSEKNED